MSRADICSKHLRQREFVFPDTTEADVARIVSIRGLIWANMTRANIGGFNTLVGVVTFKEPVTREAALALVGHEPQMNHKNGALEHFRERARVAGTISRDIGFVNPVNQIGVLFPP